MKNLLTLVLLIISVTTFRQSSEFPSIWKTLNTIQKYWLMVERDSAGYLVYDPCNGGTPRIYIDSGYVTIYWQLDGPSKLLVNKFTLLSGNKSFYINAADTYGSTEFTIEIKDDRHKLVLWTFGDFKWVMIPLEFAKDFRQVNNPCPGEMKREKQFLPVEF